MKARAKFVGVALLGALLLLAAPAAQAQVGVTINVGTPAWGPQVPYGTQYYYIPEIDGYYDLYAQQYIVSQDGYWVPLPELYGYDPYQFHPVIVRYRGREPWLQSSYYHQRYAYQPYRSYGRGSYGNGYGYGYGRNSYYGGRRNDRDRDHDRDRDDYGRNYGSNYGSGRNDHDGRGNYGDRAGNDPRNGPAQPPYLGTNGGNGNNTGSNGNGGPRGGYGSPLQQPPLPQPSGNNGQIRGASGNEPGQGSNGDQGLGSGRRRRD